MGPPPASTSTKYGEYTGAATYYTGALGKSNAIPSPWCNHSQMWVNPRTTGKMPVLPGMYGYDRGSLPIQRPNASPVSRALLHQARLRDSECVILGKERCPS
jgi:hypothetical protein